MEVGEHQSTQLNEIRKTIQCLKTEFNKETKIPMITQAEMKVEFKKVNNLMRKLK